MAAYLSGLKEDASTKARLIFNVTEDAIVESVIDPSGNPSGIAAPKVHLGIKKPAKNTKTEAETTDFGL